MNLLKKIKAFRQRSLEKNAQNCGNILKNPRTVKDQRTEALESLANMPPVLAVPQLLKRYEMVLDHGIQDTREKERVLELLVQWADVSKPFIEEAVRTHKRVSWSIKTAEKILELPDFIKLLVSALHTEFIHFDESVQERNIEILLALKDYPDPMIVRPAFQLVLSRDESVRLAALECLESQGEHNQEARELLLQLSQQDVTDENSRLVGTVKGILQSHSWFS